MMTGDLAPFVPARCESSVETSVNHRQEEAFGGSGFAPSSPGLRRSSSKDARESWSLHAMNELATAATTMTSTAALRIHATSVCDDGLDNRNRCHDNSYR